MTARSRGSRVSGFRPSAFGLAKRPASLFRLPSSLVGPRQVEGESDVPGIRGLGGAKLSNSLIGLTRLDQRDGRVSTSAELAPTFSMARLTSSTASLALPGSRRASSQAREFNASTLSGSLASTCRRRASD